MDQVTINATTEFLQSELLKKDYNIATLEESSKNAIRRAHTEMAERNRMRNEMQEWTLESLEQGTIEELQAEEIASICGFELTKEFELEVTVNYSITVNARNEEEAQNAIHDIDFDTVSYNEDNVKYLSSSIDRIEI